MDIQKITSVFKKRPLLTAVVVGVVAVGLAVFLRYDLLDEHETKLAELQANSAKFQRNVTNSIRLDNQLEELRKINASIEELFIRPSELARNAQFFYTLEAENQISLGQMVQGNIGRPAAGATFAPLTFNLSVRGDYEQLLKFMRELEKTFLGGKILTADLTLGASLTGENPEKARALSLTFQTIATTK